MLDKPEANTGDSVVSGVLYHNLVLIMIAISTGAGVESIVFNRPIPQPTEGWLAV